MSLTGHTPDQQGSRRQAGMSSCTMPSSAVAAGAIPEHAGCTTGMPTAPAVWGWVRVGDHMLILQLTRAGRLVSVNGQQALPAELTTWASLGAALGKQPWGNRVGNRTGPCLPSGMCPTFISKSNTTRLDSESESIPAIVSWLFNEQL